MVTNGGSEKRRSSGNLFNLVSLGGLGDDGAIDKTCEPQRLRSLGRRTRAGLDVLSSEVPERVTAKSRSLEELPWDENVG